MDPSLEQSRLAVACERWQLTDALRIANTPTSWVVKARQRTGADVVVKLLKPAGREELRGVDLLVWYGAKGAVHILDQVGDDILMEWLEGLTLGDLVRDGADVEATQILCQLVEQLQAPRRSQPVGLITLEEQFAPLLAGDFDFWPSEARELGFMVGQMARDLLKTTRTEIPLHGDLHHDNVIGGISGWKVIDAKGLIGDPAYEFSNIFRNPIGADELVHSVRRAQRLRDTFAASSGFDPTRILNWAIVHAAQSTFWNQSAGNSIEDDLTMVRLLLKASGDH